MQDAHSCDKCSGKIFLVSIDLLGVTRCGYCSRVVNYPKATPEEMKSWMGKMTNKYAS